MTVKIPEYSEILKSLASEHEIFVVVGGGKPAREYIGVVRELELVKLSAMILELKLQELMLNCYYLHLEMLLIQKVPHNFQEALEYSATGKIIVMGGTEPAHSTDAVSAILAEYIHADKLINLTSVDGMYDKDPNKYEDAKLIKEITASEMIEFISGKDTKAGTYEFFDMTAIQMIKRSSLETVIANGYDSENLIKAINGEEVGTKVISK